MCNSVLRVKRRLLALLLIVGCMAISAPALARVCFLPDSKDCGIPGIKDIPETCDGINTFTDVDDCKNNMADGQKCEPVNEGGCYAATCEYANKAACEADVNEYCTDNSYYFCEYDSSIGCYVLNKQECSYNTENKCAGYTLDQEEDGKTCCACTRTTCKKCGQTKDVTKYKCIETKYQEVGCDDFDKTEAEADTLKAQNYTCTSCTREKQKQTCDGSWDKYGNGETVYKCTRCTETKDCSDYTYTTLSDTTNATSCNNGCGETKWKCNVGYSYDSATKSCKKDCNITIACKNMKPLGGRSDIDNTTKEIPIEIRYSCTISNYDDVKSYLNNLDLVIKTKLACIKKGTDSDIDKQGQYYEMTKIPFSKATSSTFSGIYELYNPLYKDKLDCGSNYTSYEGTMFEFDNKTGCTISTTTKKNTCATWSLKTEAEANCGAGEIFKQDITHKTDDNGDKCGTCVQDNSQCYGTANIHLAYYHNWPDNDGVLKGKKSIELGFNSVDKVAYLPYKDDISQTSVTLDDNHTYYRAVYPKLDNISTKCYYKVITKEEYEKTTGLTLKTSGRPNSISDLSFYGSVWQDWPSNDVVNCKGDWVAIMACLTDHGADSINQNSSCSQYDSHYGYCDGDAHDGTLLPPEINAGSTSYGGVHRCCVKFGTR